jgi:hypothetical protein
MQKIIGGKRYDTDKADLVASNRYWDGHNWERHGRNTYLYRTNSGNWFLHHTTLWEGERDSIEPVTREEAKHHYEALPESCMTFEDAFGESPEDA